MKKLLSMFFLLTLAVFSTGCMRIYETLTVNNDSTVDVTIKEAISKQLYDDSDKSPDADAILETLEDGEEYYCTTETKQYTAEEANNSSGMIISKDIFFYGINNASDESLNSGYSIGDAIEKNIYLKLTVNLSDDIVDTNANVTGETTGRTATFDNHYTEASWYAYTARGKEIIDSDITPPTINNIEDGGSYKTLPNISYTDDVGIATVSLNGQTLSLRNIRDGRNEIIITDLKGNSKTITFYIDNNMPAIKGIKNNRKYKKKAVFYVRDNIELASVTIDKKKQKLTKKYFVKKGKYKNYYKYTIKKRGKHTIIATDKAGNTRKYKITIR